MEKINFEKGTQVSPAKVMIDNIEHEVTPAVWKGNTPLSPFVLNKLQDNIENAIENKRLKLEGKSEQDGTPSSDNLIEIRNIGDNINSFDKDNAKLSNAYFDSKTGAIINGGASTITTTYTKIVANQNFVLTCKKLGRVVFYDDDKNIIKVTTTSSPFVFNENASYIRMQYETAGSDINSIKLEQGSIASPYTPYGCGSIDYKVENADKTESKNIHFPLSKGQLLHEGDYIASDEIHQKRKTYIVTGDENWKQSSSITSYLALWLVDVINDCVTNEYSINVKSNIATGIDYNSKWGGANLVSCRANTLTFTLDNVKTLEGAKTYFKTQYANGTPVIIEYELAEEIVTPLTKEQIEADYELQKAKYVDKMELTCLNEIEPTLVDIEKSLEESLLDNEEAITNIKEQHEYSTEEQIVGTFLGKPLYRKVINFGALPNNGLKYVKHNISNIKYVKSCTGLAMSSVGGGLIVPSYNGTIYTNCYPTATEVHVKTNGDRSSFTTCYITMEYTKTTD